MQQEIDLMELAKLLLQFAVLPIVAFMWAHYKMTQMHQTEIAVPLFFKAQRDEATMDEWLALVAEIKMRYPYPT